MDANYCFFLMSLVSRFHHSLVVTNGKREILFIFYFILFFVYDHALDLSLKFTIKEIIWIYAK